MSKLINEKEYPIIRELRKRKARIDMIVGNVIFASCKGYEIVIEYHEETFFIGILETSKAEYLDAMNGEVEREDYREIKNFKTLFDILDSE